MAKIVAGPPPNGAADNIMIDLKHISMEFDKQEVVKSIDLSVFKGEFLTLLGASGCGKTTTLRMIAGFETPTDGEIWLDGENMAGRPPYARNVNTVFQSYALFPHMNVYDNIAFGLVEKKMPKKEIKEHVARVLEMVQLQGFEKRRPSQMSGGQRQRVAIARAIVNNPKVLLLDEPLGALDLKLRRQMQMELKHLQKKLGITFLYVTHDQEEALTMSDRIAVMNRGRIEQIGTAQEIYEHPASRFVADFIGESNILEGYVTSMEDSVMTVSFEFGQISSLPSKGFVKEEMIYVSVRPENVRYSTEPVNDFRLRGIVKEHIYAGSQIRTIVELPNSQEIKLTSHPQDAPLEPGSSVYLYWNMEKTVLLHTDGDKVYDLIEDAVLKDTEGVIS